MKNIMDELKQLNEKLGKFKEFKDMKNILPDDMSLFDDKTEIAELTKLFLEDKRASTFENPKKRDARRARIMYLKNSLLAKKKEAEKA